MKAVYSLRTLLLAAAVTTLSLTSHASAQDEAAEKKAEPAKPVARAVAQPATVRPLSVNINLLGKTEIAGTLTDATAVEMRTAFGIANIPLSEVAGIRFASADNASTTVVMLNGDSITGATDIKLMTVETEWGVATINGQNISSVLFVPGLQWNPQSGLNGKRWNLASTKAEETPAVALPPTAAQAPRGTTVRSPYPNSVPQNVYRGR
jgi:hypothetical protein